MPPALLRVLGAPGAGKTLLIATLVEEFRNLGHFVATSAPREGATVITTSSGARITAERPLVVTCYEVMALDGMLPPSHWDELERLASWGLPVPDLRVRRRCDKIGRAHV